MCEMKTKRLIAILCAAVLMMSAAILPASAETNHCDEFASFVSSLFLGGITSTNTDECINGISVSKMLEYTFYKSFYKSDAELPAHVPYATFKAEAAKHFDLSGTGDRFDSIAKADSHYDPGKDEIVWGGGGYGDSYHFEIYGYIPQNGKYEVYGFGADIYDDDKAPAGAVKYKDYITVKTEGGEYDLRIEQIFKVSLRINGNILQFISSEKISALPTGGNMILPGDTVPSGNTSSTASAASGNESSQPMLISTGDNGVTVELGDGCGVTFIDNSGFPEGTVITVQSVSDEKDKADIKNVLSDKIKTESITVMEITSEHNGMAVQPDAPVRVGVDVPAGCDIKKIAVYYVTPDRTSVEEIETEINEADGTVVALVPHFSTYVVAEKLNADVTPSSDPDESKGGVSPLPFIIGGIAVIAAAAVVTVIAIKKKRSNKN